jgi:hypothetical protein
MAEARSLPEKALRRLALTAFEAVCEALYPENDFGAPSWRDTDMVARAASLWDELPPPSRLTLEAIYATVELLGAAFAPGVGPFSALPVGRREKALERLKVSRVWPLRLLGEAVKSSSTMVYLSHPAALRHIGDPRTCLGEMARRRGAPAERAEPGPFAGLVGGRLAGDTSGDVA